MQPDFCLPCVWLSLICLSFFHFVRTLFMNEWMKWYSYNVPSFSPCSVQCDKMWLERMKIMGFIMSVGLIVIAQQRKKKNFRLLMISYNFFLLFLHKCSVGTPNRLSRIHDCCVHWNCAIHIAAFTFCATKTDDFFWVILFFSLH